MGAGTQIGAKAGIRARVADRRQLAPGAFLLRIDLKLDFVPGQNVAVTVDPGLPPRAYSIASGTGDPFTEILFTVVPGGRLTPLLARLEAGDLLYLSEPFGAFRDDERPAWWIAGGTGIAPFRSMVLSGLRRGKTLVQGSSRLERLYFRGELAARLGDGPPAGGAADARGAGLVRRLRPQRPGAACGAADGAAYRPCWTRPTDAGAGGPPAEGVYRGRLVDALRALQPPPDRRYLLCGGAEMVVEVREMLLARGVPFMNVLAEIFF